MGSSIRLLRRLALTTSLLGVATLAPAADPGATTVAAGSAGMVKTLKGSVTIERDGRKLAATVGAAVLVADRVTTGADGAVGLTLRDNTMLSAGPNSTLELDRFAFDPTTHAGTLQASVRRGSLAVISGKIAAAAPEAVSFKTPKATLGVRGTEFVIEAGDEETQR